MIDEILVCLDGSSLAEKIVPFAQNIATAQRATLTVFKVIADPGDLVAEEIYLRESARRFGAEIKFAVSRDPAQAIVEELKKSPRAMGALTTHGRTAWGEAVLGSVALKVLRGSARPLMFYRPLNDQAAQPVRISTVTVALDGSEFAEKIVPHAAELTKSLGAGLTLIQALPLPSPAPPLPEGKKTDLVESAYLHRQAQKIQKAYHVDAQWDVLHGDAAEAICRYLKGTPGTLLAMTSHGRGPLERAVLGSVAGECIRHAGCPLLLLWSLG